MEFGDAYDEHNLLMWPYSVKHNLLSNSFQYFSWSYFLMHFQPDNIAFPVGHN